MIVLRFVDENWHIQQKVARLLLVAKSMTGQELARELVLTLSSELKITEKHLLASMHDRASARPSISEQCGYADIEDYLPQYSGHRVFFPYP